MGVLALIHNSALEDSHGVQRVLIFNTLLLRTAVWDSLCPRSNLRTFWATQTCSDGARCPGWCDACSALHWTLDTWVCCACCAPCQRAYKCDCMLCISKWPIPKWPLMCPWLPHVVTAAFLWSLQVYIRVEWRWRGRKGRYGGVYNLTVGLIRG